MARTPTCHPERQHQAKGLCSPCYLAAWHRAHPGRSKNYSAAFQERRPEAGRLYYLANADRIKARQKRRYDADPNVRAGQIARRHGLTIQERERLLSLGCAICGGTATDIDHDHNTGRVRAGLCNACNAALGLLRDDPDLAANAAQYLASHRQLKVV